MTLWAQKRLGDIAMIAWGDTTKTKAAYTDSGYIAFSASGPDGFMDHYDHEGPGVVLSAIGAQCGKTWFVQGKWSCIKNTIYLKAKPNEVDPRFLYYITANREIWPIRGAAQPFISQTDARAISIRVPPASTQRRIAAILAAYDDLIENNTRRIAILEEMARRIYEEWFVRFRFPGHEGVRMVESELGSVPEGWTIDQLGAVCDVTDYVANGSFASLKENVTYRDEPDYAVLVRGTDFNSGWNGKYVYVTEHSYRFLKKSALRVGDIVVTNVGNVGITFFVPDLGRPMTLGPNSVLARPRKGAAFMFHFFRSDDGQHRIHGITSGAAQPKFNKTEFRSMRIAVPSEGVLSEFDRVVAPIHGMREKLRATSWNLRSTRDLLLPKLISGELDTSALPEPEALAA
jgi:type I restriction enzyme S subunit